jgi:hypothetical protein
MWTWEYLAQQLVMLSLWLVLLRSVYKELRRWSESDDAGHDEGANEDLKKNLNKNLNKKANEIFAVKKRHRKDSQIAYRFLKNFPVRPSTLPGLPGLPGEELPRRFPS